MVAKARTTASATQGGFFQGGGGIIQIDHSRNRLSVPEGTLLSAEFFLTGAFCPQGAVSFHLIVSQFRKNTIFSYNI